MKTTHRNYAEEAGDFNRLGRFIIANNQPIRTYSTWCLGRFVDWKYGLYENKRAVPDFCGQNAQLWFDAFGDLAGFVIAENGDAGFAIITADGYRFLFTEMLAWVLAHWGERQPPFAIEITEQQAAEAAILQEYGFQHAGTFFTRRFDLTKELPPRVPLEAGFTIVDLDVYPNYWAQRLLRANAFQGKSTFTEEEVQEALLFYNHSHHGPIYHAPTDLCVVAPDGRFVAGCEALIDARNAEADIERVCTHSDYRRRGLARAVIQECLYRLQQMGMRRAYITGYSPEAVALYGSLGAVDETKAFIYKR
ncbi:MAG: N-acetyltransferase [Caldilinea sp. CFX5]|nr:N-acetyltransferase [Caldilinea sp. CFX5]